MNVIIVDDELHGRENLKILIEKHCPSVNVLGLASNVFEANKLIELHKPNVVFLDVAMGLIDGITYLKSLKERDFQVIIVSAYRDYAMQAMENGAFGYLLKDESAENITDMLWQMHESGAGPISPGIAHKILQLVQNNRLTLVQKQPEPDSKTLFDLTDREKEILQLLVEGLSYKEIGVRLDISPNTAKKHVINIYNKLHVNSRAQALHLAYQKGLL